MNDFIQKLQKKRSNYNDPDQATMQENSLDKLSSGIYTEGERFIFELLQNAVDAHSDVGLLDIRIVIQDGYLVFMHNGDAFTNEDIDAICFVGKKGEKTRNIKKIGYKGIGFKSVFGNNRNKVFIHSGNNCFRFDKNYWQNYWGEHWKSEYGEYDTSYTMPWQVIPIESQCPINIDENGFNVATYIAIEDIDDEKKLVDSIKTLMQSSRFLIFLKDKNIKINFTYNNETQCEIEKETIGDIIVLKIDGDEDSQWLVHSNPEVELNLTSGQQKKIEKDKNLPEKLKNATTFDLSFAIELKDGKLKETDDAVLYTYLPTSFKFGDIGFPFLVNANFITDEGRQHLDVDAEWNKVIVSKIPEEYLKWIATLSKQYPNYYEVLPQISYGESNALLCSYSEAIEKAITKIAFIPNTEGILLLTQEAVIDLYGLKDIIPQQSIINHINKEYEKAYKDNCWINESGKNILKEYGVFVFGKKCLEKLLEDRDSIEFNTSKQSLEFILFLQNYMEEHPSEKDTLKDVLYKTKFIYSNDNQLHSPSDVYFPSEISIEGSNFFFVGNDIKEYYTTKPKTKEWLKYIGVEELSLGIYINNVICSGHYVTQENAIDIGRIIYKAYLQGELSSISHGKRLQLKFLTTKGTLKNVSELYMSTIYNPRLDFQEFCDDDIFVSEEYAKIGDPNVWHCIWANLDIPDDIQPCKIRCRKEYLESLVPQKVQQRLADETRKVEDPNQYVWPYGYDLDYYPNTINNENNNQLKIIFSKIFKSSYKVEDESRYLDYRWSIEEHLAYRGDFWKKSFQNFNLREFLLKYVQKYPTTMGIPMYAEEIFINSQVNVEIAGDFLPILDIEVPIDDYKWVETLPFKRELDLDNILEILSLISNKNEIEENDKIRIAKIYRCINERYNIASSSIKEKLLEWGKTNKLLAKDNKFYPVSELSYIIVPGFNSTKIVYTEEQDAKLIELFKLFGVKVIDYIDPSIDHPSPCDTFKECLLERAPLMAILSKNDCTFADEVNKIRERIRALNLCHADEIKLSYGDENDIQKRSYFYNNDDNSFYFTGEWESPHVLMSIVEPLCEVLHIKKSYSQYLSVLLLSRNFLDDKNYLKEQGFDVNCISDEYVPQVAQTFKGLTAREEMELIESDLNDGNIPSEGVATNTRASFAEEAQKRIMEVLKNNNCAFDTSGHSYTVLYSITLPDGRQGKAIMKSAKGGYLYFTPREWLELATGNSMLLLVDQNNQVKNVNIEELEESNDHFHMRFDTHIFAAQSNLTVFAKFFKPMPQGSVYFVFGVPYGFSKANYLDEFGLDKQNTSAIDVTEDDINMLS